MDATFLDPYDGKGDEKKSFTSSVRVTSPTGRWASEEFNAAAAISLDVS